MRLCLWSYHLITLFLAQVCKRFRVCHRHRMATHRCKVGSLSWSLASGGGAGVPQIWPDLGGGKSNIVYFHPKPWEKWSILTCAYVSKGLVKNHQPRNQCNKTRWKSRTPKTHLEDVFHSCIQCSIPFPWSFLFLKLGGRDIKPTVKRNRFWFLQPLAKVRPKNQL